MNLEYVWIAILFVTEFLFIQLFLFFFFSIIKKATKLLNCVSKEYVNQLFQFVENKACFLWIFIIINILGYTINIPLIVFFKNIQFEILLALLMMIVSFNSGMFLFFYFTNIKKLKIHISNLVFLEHQFITNNKINFISNKNKDLTKNYEKKFLKCKNKLLNLNTKQKQNRWDYFLPYLLLYFFLEIKIKKVKLFQKNETLQNQREIFLELFYFIKRI